MTEQTPLTLTRDEVRAIDAAAIEQLEIPGLVLMENAARGVVDVILAEFPETSRILIACGYGNNGGDGLAIARQLAARGVVADVKLLRNGRDLSPDAAGNLVFLRQSGFVVDDIDAEIFRKTTESLSSTDLIVDCLLGTGVHGAVREPFDVAIEAVNVTTASVLSVDLPSGMDCDTGRPCGCCVHASRTVTFVGQKQGFKAEGAAELTGKVTVAHIGLPAKWVSERLTDRRNQDQERG